MKAKSEFVEISPRLHIRHWVGDKPPFLLVHGLASNSRTWDQVGDYLALAGHQVVAVDQRGHGLSDKPTTGYDFQTVTADLRRLIEQLGLERPYMVGQSWGGNVLLEFAAHYPGLARAFGFVDGGTIDLQANPTFTWEKVSEMLAPPHLIGLPATTLRQRIENAHPDWSPIGVEGTMSNFEELPDGTVRPWLSRERHMLILRALWEQRPQALYPLVQEPILICMAEFGDPNRVESKRRRTETAEQSLKKARSVWFSHTDHDIHIHRPQRLTEHLLKHDADSLEQEQA